MATDTTLWQMEEQFWTQGAEAARHMTAKDAIFVYPYPYPNPNPAGILRGDSLWLKADAAQRWRSVVMLERHISKQSSIAVLTYAVSAERGGAPIYNALCTSSYLKDEDKWLRLTHQQTPVA